MGETMKMAAVGNILTSPDPPTARMFKLVTQENKKKVWQEFLNFERCYQSEISDSLKHVCDLKTHHLTKFYEVQAKYVEQLQKCLDHKNWGAALKLVLEHVTLSVTNSLALCTIIIPSSG